MVGLFKSRKKDKAKRKEAQQNTAINFEDHETVMKELKKSQDAEIDSRERAREADLFINKRDGQWEPFWWDLNKNKPRYTFDLTTNVVNQITAKIKKADFAGRIKPTGGEATKELAQTYDGLVRNIQSISQAGQTYSASAKNMVTTGIDGWEVVQKFVDSDTFDQDLMVEDVHNFADRVWFNVGAQEQDKSDSFMGWKFTGFSREEYEKKWPDGKAGSMPQNKINNSFFNKPDLIMVGQFYYIKEVEREIVLMSNNAVYEADEEFDKIKDELADLGVTEVRRRMRLKRIVWTRKMDSQDWLDEPVETVFDFVPLIPTYGNYKVIEDKMIYFGAVEKRLDPQRVFNYSMSREIEEGALAPRAKYWLTEKQGAAHADTLATLNTNVDPVQYYTPDQDATQPIAQIGGAQINPGLRTISEATGNLIPETSGQFEANQGDNPNAQSGVAIEKLQLRGDAGSIDYFESQEIAICHTMRILIRAIPKVYVGQRQVRLLKEDDSFEMVMLNEQITDEETQELITINDLSIGTYDVSCSAGVAFQNRQQETVSAMVEIGGVDPSIIQLGSDILLNNVSAPGMDLIADRKRLELFNAGVIPEDQWTDDEKEQVQLQQLMAQLQPPEPTPEQMIGQAELIKAQDEQLETQVSIEEKRAKIQLADRKEDREDAKLGLTRSTNAFTQMLSMMKQLMDQQTAQADELNTQAATMKLIREAAGLETFTGPGIVDNFITQSDLVSNSQNEQ